MSMYQDITCHLSMEMVCNEYVMNHVIAHVMDLVMDHVMDHVME